MAKTFETTKLKFLLVKSELDGLIFHREEGDKVLIRLAVLSKSDKEFAIDILNKINVKEA